MAIPQLPDGLQPSTDFLAQHAQSLAGRALVEKVALWLAESGASAAGRSGAALVARSLVGAPVMLLGDIAGMATAKASGSENLGRAVSLLIYVAGGVAVGGLIGAVGSACVWWMGQALRALRS